MVYENSQCSRDEIRTMHKLVAQVTRAFFDPHYVIIMDRMMTSDMHLEGGLAHQVGVPGGGSNGETNIGKFLKPLARQRLVKSFMNYENSAGKSADGIPMQKRGTLKRNYWYIDYHEVVLVIKYRLAVMRSQIEASMVKDDTAKNDYKCPQCGQEFDALQIPGLIQNLSMSMMDREGDFIIACDVCGAHLEPKMNEKEQSEADKKMENFNNAMAPIRKTLQQVEKIRFEKFDPLQWLLNHVPETIIVERNAKGGRIYVPYDKKETDVIELTAEEKQRRIDAEAARKAEIEQNKQILPTWAVQSTVTGQQTELGAKHEKLQQVVAERAARANLGQTDTKIDHTDADLDAHYARARLMSNGGHNEDSNKPSESLDSPDQASPFIGTLDDEEDDMEAVDTSANKTEEIQALKDSFVKVGGEDMKFGEVSEEDQEKMSSDEYLQYYRIAEELAQLEEPSADME